MKKTYERNKTAVLLSLLYFIPGMLWVLFGDRIAGTAAIRGDDAYKRMDTLRDGIFVTVVSIMLFLLFYVYQKRVTKTKKEYEYLFDHHPQPMWIFRLDTRRIVAVNREAVRIYGYPENEFIGMHLEDFRPPEDIDSLNKHLLSLTAGESKPTVWRHRKKNGEIIMVEIAGNDVVFHSHACRLVCSVDVTEKVKAQRAVKQLSLVAEYATNAVIILNKDSQIEWVNDSFIKLTGFTYAEVAGKRPSSFLHGPLTSQKTEEEIQRTIAAEKQYSGEILNYRKDGSMFWLRLTISPVWTNGKVSNYITVQTDITPIKQQNEKLRDLVITASHGVRKPLANILGLINVAKSMASERSVLEELEESSRELDAEIRRIVKKLAGIDDLAN